MPRRVLQGVVVSKKNNKTVIVKVERRFKHPMYKKIVKVSKKYAVHDPNNLYNNSDIINIIECRPISKTKSWIVFSDQVKTIINKK